MLIGARFMRGLSAVDVNPKYSDGLFAPPFRSGIVPMFPAPSFGVCGCHRAGLRTNGTPCLPAPFALHKLEAALLES